MNLNSVTITSVILTGLVIGGGLSFLKVNNENNNDQLAIVENSLNQENILAGGVGDNQAENTQISSNRLSNESKALKAIDKLASHPNDPQNPSNVLGVSDEQLRELSEQDYKELMTLALPYIENHIHKPRYMFALGRAALLHDDQDMAKKLLNKASQIGSPAADAYLNFLTEDMDEIKSHLEKAVNGGFVPARRWLEQVQVAMSEEENQNTHSSGSNRIAFDPNKFNRPDLIKAFYNGDIQGLNQDILSNFTYVSTVHNFLSDQNAVLFIAENREIIMEIDPNLSYKASQKMLSSRRGVEQATNAGLQSIMGPLMAFAETRRRNMNNNTGLMEGAMAEAQSLNLAALNSPLAKLELLKKNALQDAQRLVILYDYDPDSFRRVYKGMKAFIEK